MSWYNDVINLEGYKVLIDFDNDSQLIGYINEKGTVHINDNEIQPFVVDKKGKRIINTGIKDVKLMCNLEHDLNEWYKNLSGEGLDGKHVEAIGQSMSNSSDSTNRTVIQGKLDSTGSIHFSHFPEIKVFHCFSDHTEKSEGVDFVKLIWDERNYTVISVDKIRESDQIVMNGDLYTITKINEESQGHVEYVLQDEHFNRNVITRLPADYGLRSIYR